jgi:hypothetical protein
MARLFGMIGWPYSATSGYARSLSRAVDDTTSGWMTRPRVEAPKQLALDIVFVYSNISKVN